MERSVKNGRGFGLEASRFEGFGRTLAGYRNVCNDAKGRLVHGAMVYLL